MAMIRRVRTQTNPDLAYYILITLMDRRNRIHRTLSEQLRLTFKDGLLETVIEIDTKLRESTVAGLPITHYTPHSRSALQYRALAQELIQDVQKNTA
jgi:chromosome partitioning protein